jgi:RNA polymerase sigma-70 factor (ECF subfamily)
MDSLKAMLLPFRPQEIPPERDRAATVRNAISMLPPHQGQAVLLRALEDIPYHAIAKILGCSEATARSHVSKGKARLAKILLDLGIS